MAEPIWLPYPPERLRWIGRCEHCGMDVAKQGGHKDNCPNHPDRKAKQ